MGKEVKLTKGRYCRDLAARGPWWWIAVFTLASMIAGPFGDFYFGAMRELLK